MRETEVKSEIPVEMSRCRSPLYMIVVIVLLPVVGNCQQAATNPFSAPLAKLQYAPDRSFDFEHVALNLRIDYDRRTFSGTVDNTVAPLRDGLKSVEVHAGDNLRLHGCSIDGHSMPCDRKHGILTIVSPAPLVRGQKVHVAVHFESGGEQTGFHWIEPDPTVPGRTGFFTRGATMGHPSWLPTWNYPNDLVTSEMRVTVPADWYVVSNGILESSVLNAGDKTRTFHWVMDVPHSTNLISLAGGPFEIHTATWEDIPLLYIVPRGYGEAVANTFGETPDMLSFYSKLFKTKYPWPKYAQTAQFDFHGGMEWVSATSFGVGVLGDPRQGNPHASPIIAHELVHQWFGDLVVCKDWGDLWLSEGFATYFGQILYAEHWQGRPSYDRAVEGAMQGYFGESRRYERSLSTRFYRDPPTLFDSHTYSKGALILHMLRRMLGDQTFFDGIALYLSKYKYTPVTPHDFAGAMADASGLNLEPFFADWVYRPGHPVLDYTWRWAGTCCCASSNCSKKTGVPSTRSRPAWVLFLKER